MTEKGSDSGFDSRGVAYQFKISGIRLYNGVICSLLHASHHVTHITSREHRIDHGIARYLLSNLERGLMTGETSEGRFTTQTLYNIEDGLAFLRRRIPGHYIP